MNASEFDMDTEVARLREQIAETNCNPTHIILEGDMGGTMYLTCPVRLIAATIEEIDTLLAWLEERYWDNCSAGSDWYFASTEVQNRHWHEHPELQIRFTEKEYTSYSYGWFLPLNDDLWIGEDLASDGPDNLAEYKAHISQVLLGKE